MTSPDQSRHHVGAILRVVVERSIKISGDNANKISSKLFIVKTAFYLAHAFGVSVAFI